MTSVLRRVGLGLLLLGAVLPLLPLLLWAVAGQWRYPALLPTSFSTRGLRLLGAPGSDVLEGLATSTAVAVTVAGVATVLGTAAGRALGLRSFPGKRLVQFLLLAPVLVPSLAVVLGIHVLFVRYGLTDTRLGVVLVHLIPTTPYATLVMASVFAGYDTQFEDQARVLGAGPVRVLAAVTLPAVLPGMAVAALFAFLVSWSEYVLTLLVGGGTVKTLPLLLFSSLGTADTPKTAALALVLVVPPVLLVALSARYVGGVRLGGGR